MRFFFEYNMSYNIMKVAGNTEEGQGELGI